ncbi:MAG: PIN domain-containing protein [Thermoguttaceae bacterium]|jgi:predicted nucleic acid-binding protein
MDVFLDTNVLLDVLAKREPFYEASAAVWTLAEQGKVRGLVSALSFPNVYYVVRRLRDRRAAATAMRLLRDTFTPVPLDEQVLYQAMDAGLKDFEDAIQYFSAVRKDAACLISRDPDHFPPSTLSVLTPAEFLAAHSLALK